MAKLFIDWRGYWVLLGLPIDPNEAHCSDRVVRMDMPLPEWGETRPACNRATRPLEVGNDAREKTELGPSRPQKKTGTSPSQLLLAS
jgi:hypothetical protein